MAHKRRFRITSVTWYWKSQGYSWMHEFLQCSSAFWFDRKNLMDHISICKSLFKCNKSDPLLSPSPLQNQWKMNSLQCGIKTVMGKMKWATINHSRNQSGDEESVTVYLVEMQENCILQTIRWGIQTGTVPRWTTKIQESIKSTQYWPTIQLSSSVMTTSNLTSLWKPSRNWYSLIGLSF